MFTFQQILNFREIKRKKMQNANTETKGSIDQSDAAIEQSCHLECDQRRLIQGKFTSLSRGESCVLEILA